MTAAGSAARSAGAGLSIGAVLAKLRPEFPDLSISKIRFLESEELVTPQRTASGYRQFSGADIERLRFILTAQRDHYLPLKVIREQLDAADRGLEPATPAARLPRALVVAESALPTVLGDPGRVRMTREELLVEAELADADLAEAESFGLIESGPGGYFDSAAVLAARTLAELIAIGVEPRHLRAMRSAADREAAMVAHVVGAQARKKDPDARARAMADATAHAATLLRLHALLVKSGLSRELGS